jgi:DNA polymerase III epsilon subunit
MTADDLADKPKFCDIVDEFLEFVNGAELLIHNAPFDVAFLNAELELIGRPRLDTVCTVTDTLALARDMHPGKKNSLDALCERYAVDHSQRTLHGALLDAQLLADVWLAMTRGQETLDIAHGRAERRRMALRAVARCALHRGAREREELAAHAAMCERIERESKGRACGCDLAPSRRPRRRRADGAARARASSSPRGSSAWARSRSRSSARCSCSRALLGPATSARPGVGVPSRSPAAWRASSCWARSPRARWWARWRRCARRCATWRAAASILSCRSSRRRSRTLKRDVLGLAQDMQSQQGKMQERLDTARQQIFFLTNHDPLTGLPNRKALEERLESALASAKSQGSTHALLYLDIDHFHRINDSFGHLAGDDLLRRITPILQSSLREGETLARIGGDEFAVLLENCSAEFAQAAATQLRDAVQSWQFEWSEKAFQVGVSIGVVAITKLAPSLSAILSEADTACFTAKEQGRNRVFAFHDASTSQYMRQTSRGWLKRINDALTEGAFTLLYQPILPIENPRIVGMPRAEALLRMSETGGELILPMSFIPVAERYDLMRTIDRWVIERAFSDYRRLAKLRDNPTPAEFSINLSGHTLSSPDFAEFMQDKFSIFNVPPQCLYFEITETAAIATWSARAVSSRRFAAWACASCSTTSAAASRRSTTSSTFPWTASRSTGSSSRAWRRTTSTTRWWSRSRRSA